MPHDGRQGRGNLRRDVPVRLPLRLAAFYALIVSLAGMMAASHADAAGTPAPDFELVTFSGEVYSKDALRGHPALLVFWAPWCNVCQRELPLLSEYFKKDRPTRLKILSIGFADTRGNVEAFVTSHPGAFAFSVAYDDDRWVAQAFKVNATPTAVLIDERGTIVLVHRGGGLLQNGQFLDFISTSLK